MTIKLLLILGFITGIVLYVLLMYKYLNKKDKN